MEDTRDSDLNHLDSYLDTYYVYECKTAFCCINYSTLAQFVVLMINYKRIKLLP